MSDDLVVVTGAAGFIGSNIATMLSARARVVICDNFCHTESWRYLAGADLYDAVTPDELREWLGRHASSISAIVHMGAISSTTETDVRKIIAANIRLSLDLWELSARHGFTFIYASSAATYGDGSAGFDDEDSRAALARLRPLNPYGWSKHFVDRRIAADRELARPTPPRWAGLKFFNVYGPHEGHKGSMRSVVHQLYPIAARRAPMKLFRSDHPGYPDGGQLRDFIYVKDCCAVVAAMLAASDLEGIYNVGTGKARTFEDLARAVAAAAGVPPLIEYIEMPERLRGKYQYFTEAATTKLVESGLAPTFHSLESGIADYVESYLRAEFASGSPG